MCKCRDVPAQTECDALTEVPNPVLFPRAEAQHVEHLPLPDIASTIPPQEALRPVKIFSERLQLRAVAAVGDVPGENQDLEARIRREHVLDLDRLRARSADEDLRRNALSNG